MNTAETLPLVDRQPSPRSMEVGGHAESAPSQMTKERMRWYCDALETAASSGGEFIVAEPTIHTDSEYAKAQGLPGIVADGMLSTNAISGLLYRLFGISYLSSGQLRTKFIRPVYENDVVQAHAVVTDITEGSYLLDVWVQTESGQKVTVGTARVPAPTIATPRESDR